MRVRVDTTIRRSELRLSFGTMVQTETTTVEIPVLDRWCAACGWLTCDGPEEIGRFDLEHRDHDGPIWLAEA